MRDKERQAIEVLGGIFEECLPGHQSIGVSVDINPDKLSEETLQFLKMVKRVLAWI